ncbi:MAG: endonuclease/exonuclease/phosphatase family protein [Saprospiraceae bacterium]|nr:endonuclease/exonuclease/phosphatase family protein [Saprospiraceae bacterium]MCF8251886.1 endonuclease/exonuclease/phosphatase family protein [Saprospiraceae bacterium]MCF8283294.1 endonuclease/exonuclease/phosphatase family protein [Bacteroidales bacterium]MCF8313563.1 endonuclease/exonuclease/phosphatase family protein [Saprospiraceae bacterium]MCF8443288.1 endonuclease/exonuclease/phosphatase family protein [Saprospiraceae bacterium]
MANDNLKLKLLKKILRWANLLLILVTLLAYLAPYVNPAKVWHFTFLGLAYPMLLFGNIGFAIFWIIRHDRYALFSIGCILAGLGYFGGFFNLSAAEKSSKNNTEIRVLTYNIGSLKDYFRSKADNKKKIKADFEAFSKRIEAPDVFCVQEGRGDDLTELIQTTFHFPFQYRYINTIIFSKFPIQAKGDIGFKNTTNSCVWADLKTPGGMVRVYSAHLQSNKLSQTADKIATKGQINDQETWRDIRFVMGRYKNAVAIRAKQAQAVASHIAKSPYPVLLCGDFNDPPVSYVYKLLSENLQDSFCEKGSGFGSTFAGNLPFLRIDYVMPSRKFKVMNHKVLPTKLSDHYPVQVLLRWTK